MAAVRIASQTKQNKKKDKLEHYVYLSTWGHFSFIFEGTTLSFVWTD
jgi:hypothetical protein